MTVLFSKISFRKMRKKIFLKNSFASRKFNPLKKKAFVASCFVNIYKIYGLLLFEDNTAQGRSTNRYLELGASPYFWTSYVPPCPFPPLPQNFATVLLQISRTTSITVFRWNLRKPSFSYTHPLERKWHQIVNDVFNKEPAG